MKAYGSKPRDMANRKIRGTSRDCPCCTPWKSHAKVDAFKRRARRLGKKEIENS